MLNKGLILTLFAVAVVLSVGRSQAMAPTIDNPGDVFISNAEGGGFNYPDAFDLLEIGSDDTVPPEDIKWSYYVAPGGHNIQINGAVALGAPDINAAVDPVDGATTPTQTRIDLHDNDTGNPNQDGSPHTVTFRNATFSPQGGPETDPITTGVLPLNTTVTLFASDCSTASMRSIIVYTDNSATSDRLTGGETPPELIRDQDLTTDRGHWRGDNLFGGGSVSSGGGLCMTAPLTGVNLLGWVYVASLTEQAYVPLVQNHVWRMRTDANMPVEVPTETAPFFDFVYKNEYFTHSEVDYNITGQEAALTYGGEHVILDNQGGANTIGFRSPGVGRDSYEFWASPAAMLLPSWNGTNGQPLDQSAFATREDGRNDFSPVIRLLDLDGAGIGAETDAGTICVTRLRVLSYDLDNLWEPTDDAVWDPPINTATHSPSTNDFIQDINNVNSKSIINNAEAAAHYKLTGGTNFQGTRKTLIPFEPVESNPANVTFNLVLYPIPWLTDKLYLIEFDAEAEVIALDPSTDLNPPSLIEVNGFLPTTEVITSHVVFKGYNGETPPNVNSTANVMYRSATPRLRSNVGGVDQRYVGLFYTHNRTASPNTDNPDRWGPRAGFFNPLVLGDDTIGLDNLKVTKFAVFDLTDKAYPDGPDSYLP